MAHRVEAHLRANPIEGLRLWVISVDEVEQGLQLNLGVGAPMQFGDTRVPEAVNAAIAFALREEPSLRGRRIDVKVDFEA